MKNLILSLFVCLFTLFSFSQSTVNFYVVNPNKCSYSLTNAWYSPFGLGNVKVIVGDSLKNQELWYLQVQDSSNQAMLTICVLPTRECNCPIECIGQILIDPYIPIIISLCGNIEFDDMKILEIKNPMVGTITIPTDEPTTFYLINSENKIIKCKKNSKAFSFDSDNLQSGFYYLISQTQTNKKIYKLLK